MDFNNMNQYPTSAKDTDDPLLNASSLDRKLANILNSLSQHAHQSNQMAQNFLYQQPMGFDNSRTIGEPGFQPSRGISTVDTSALSLSFDPNAVDQAQKSNIGLSLAQEAPSVTPTLPLGFQRRDFTENTLITLPQFNTNLLDPNHENVLLTLTNSVGLMPKQVPDQSSSAVSSVLPSPVHNLLQSTQISQLRNNTSNEMPIPPTGQSASLPGSSLPLSNHAYYMPSSVGVIVDGSQFPKLTLAQSSVLTETSSKPKVVHSVSSLVVTTSTTSSTENKSSSAAMRSLQREVLPISTISSSPLQNKLFTVPITDATIQNKIPVPPTITSQDMTVTLPSILTQNYVLPSSSPTTLSSVPFISSNTITQNIIVPPYTTATNGQNRVLSAPFTTIVSPDRESPTFTSAQDKVQPALTSTMSELNAALPPSNNVPGAQYRENDKGITERSELKLPSIEEDVDVNSQSTKQGTESLNEKEECHNTLDKDVSVNEKGTSIELSNLKKLQEDNAAEKNDHTEDIEKANNDVEENLESMKDKGTSTHSDDLVPITEQTPVPITTGSNEALSQKGEGLDTCEHHKPQKASAFCEHHRPKELPGKVEHHKPEELPDTPEHDKVKEVPSISQGSKEGDRQHSKTRITLTGKQLASLLDKSSGKKVLHIVPQKSSAGKLATIKTSLVGDSLLSQKQGTSSGKNVKVIQLKPSQIQQVKPGVYSFKIPKETRQTQKKPTGKIDNLGYALMQNKLAQSSQSSSHVSTTNKTENTLPLGQSDTCKEDGDYRSKSAQHKVSPSFLIKGPESRRGNGTVDLTCEEKVKYGSKENIFDRFLGPDDSDNSSQDSQLDETTLIQNSLSSAAHRSKATRAVLQNASTRQELYKDIKEHLRQHVNEKTVNTIDLNSYTISDSESSDSSMDTPGKDSRSFQMQFNRRGVGIRGKSYGEPLRKVVIDRGQYNKLAQVGRNVLLGMTTGSQKPLVPGLQLKRKRGRPRKDEHLQSTAMLYSMPKVHAKMLSSKKANKRKQKEDFSHRFEKTELPEHLKRAKSKKLSSQQNIIDLTKRQGSVIISESSFELDEEVHEKFAKNLVRKAWSCTLCGKTCNVGQMDTLFGPYKLRMIKETKESDKTDIDKTDIDLIDSDTSVALEVWFHRDCVIWTPNVCLVGPQLKGIGSALEEAGQIKCSLCTQYGASLACMTRMCSERYHFICAKQTGCLFKEENFSILCCKHKFPQVN